MTKIARFNVCGTLIALLDVPAFLVWLDECRAAGRSEAVRISFSNAHVNNLAYADAALCRLINESTLVAADGMAIVWAVRLLGGQLAGRCNMTDAFRAFLADGRFGSSSAVLFGGLNEVVLKAMKAMNVSSSHCRITDGVSGFLPIQAYVDWFDGRDEPDYVFLGMGTPKSEQVAQALAERLPRSIIWHIGGGTIMFYAGALVEAPVWMRRAGLQWLHRLIMEPKRMWRRYVIGNPLFVWHVMLAKRGQIRSRRKGC